MFSNSFFQEPVRFEDVKDEIFDMVRPSDPLRITLTDLVSCGQGDTVVSILVDLNGFWTYENREVLVTASDGGGGGGAAASAADAASVPAAAATGAADDDEDPADI